MLCKTCGNVEKLVTPIMAYCSHCDVMRPTNIAPPVPIPVRAPGHIPPAAIQETDQLGSETICTNCGGPEIMLTPIMALCQACNGTRSLMENPVRKPAKEEAARRELITISQQLRARGVPREARARIEERIHELQENLR